MAGVLSVTSGWCVLGHPWEGILFLTNHISQETVSRCAAQLSFLIAHLNPATRGHIQGDPQPEGELGGGTKRQSVKKMTREPVSVCVLLVRG